MLRNALKIAGLSAVFALPVISSNLFAEENNTQTEHAQRAGKKHAGNKKGGMKHHKAQGRHAQHNQAATNDADEAEEAASQFKNSLHLTDADNVSPENITERLNALKATNGLELRQGLYKIAATSRGETYTAEERELFHTLLVQAANEAEMGFDQMNEVLAVLHGNEALVTSEQVRDIYRDLNDNKEQMHHGKERKNAFPVRKHANQAATRSEAVTARVQATEEVEAHAAATPAAHEESEAKGTKKDQRQAAKKAAKTAKKEANAAKKASKAAAKADKKSCQPTKERG